jgi:hypothetical protein
MRTGNHAGNKIPYDCRDLDPCKDEVDKGRQGKYYDNIFENTKFLTDVMALKIENQSE